MLLADDPGRTVIEPLSGQTAEMRPLYDFDLMERGGHIRGWELTPAQWEQTVCALAALADPDAFNARYRTSGLPVMLFAVGDGNHSLATAKECYERQKKLCPPEQWDSLPSRYALVAVSYTHLDVYKRQLNKIALGHHYDDAVETFFLSLIFEGRLSCFQPVTWLDRTEITQIRPLLYCGENLIRHTAKRLDLPVVENPCPANGNTKRQEIKELIYELNGRYPGLKARAFGAMQRLPLPEWGPVEHRRRPLPEELEDFQ